MTQPDPIKNQHPATWDLVRADLLHHFPNHLMTDLLDEDMNERDTKGREDYGTPLQPFNGRDSLQDFFEEILDSIVYRKNYLLEKGEIEDRTYLTLLKLIIETKRELLEENI